MMPKGYENRYQIEMISIEDLVPQEHLLRQISSAVNFDNIYEFADAKEKHAMRYTPYTGLAQVTNRVRLKFATMNLKKLAK